MVAEAFVALSLAAKGPPPPGKFLAVDAQRHRVTVTLIASYDGENSGFNFDGYSRLLMWTVPRGWTVRVVCDEPRAAPALVRRRATVPTRPNRRSPARTTPQPQIGLEAGHTARFTFRASRKGVYRFACLVPGHEDARMWDVLKVTRARQAVGGRPAGEVATRRRSSGGGARSSTRW